VKENCLFTSLDRYFWSWNHLARLWLIL